MKYAKKLMVVPFVKKLENPSEKHLETLDTEMSEILHNTGLNADEKIKLYNTTLSRFSVNYDPSILGNRPVTNENKLPELVELTSLIKKLITEKKIDKKIPANPKLNVLKISNSSLMPEDKSIVDNMFNSEPIKSFSTNKIKTPEPVTPIKNRDSFMGYRDEVKEFDSDLDSPIVNERNINTRKSKKDKLAKPLSYKYRVDNASTLDDVADLNKKVDNWVTKNYFAK